MQNRELSPTLTALMGVNVVSLILFNLIRTPFLENLGSLLPLRLFNSVDFNPLQFVTYMFMHADFGHLLSNMLGLFIFAPLLEKIWGTQRFLFFYFFTGIGSGILFSVIVYFQNYGFFQSVDLFMSSPTPELFDTLCNQYYGFSTKVDFSEQIRTFYQNKDLKNEYINYVIGMKESVAGFHMMGASGAVFGVLFAFAYLFPNTQLSMMFIPITLPAKYFVLLYGAYELYFGIRKVPGDNIAHWGHLGGILFAFILLYIWGKSRKSLY